MELRRTILLFAIVLGLAAIASSLARSPERDDQATTEPSGRDTAPAPPASAEPVPEPPASTTLELGAAAEPAVGRLQVGQPATLLVDVRTPGQVDIPTLGLTQAAQPLTPARFELLVTEPGRHEIVFQPAGAETLASKIGTLQVVPAS